LYDFGIFIEVAPDEEEQAKLEQNIQVALSRNDINLEDAIDIREIKNIKVANQLLKMKRKQKDEREQQKAMQIQAMQSQQNMQSQQIAARTAMQKQQMDARAKMEVKQAEAAFDIEKMRNEAQLKMMLMAEEFKYQQMLAGINAEALKGREEMKEKAKDDRISLQNSQQSKLIDQRKNNLPPMEFESNEDSLDGFDFAEFNPR
jgi:hypothetical protein